MPMTVLKDASCGECGKPLAEDGPCQACGSRLRCFQQGVSAECRTQTSIKIRQKRPGVPGWLVEMIVGKVLRKSVGDFVHKYWRLDRAADRYVEHIETEDGKIIRDVDEPLRLHVGHGSDKPELKAARLGDAPGTKTVR
jgi:hypothetical protein